MTSAGYSALQSLGMSSSTTFGSNEPWAMIGKKGEAAGSVP